MKKLTFLITLILLCLVAFPQQYFSKGFVSNGDGKFLSGTAIQLGSYFIRHNTDSVWLEKPSGYWIASISNQATVVIDTLTKIATKYDLDTLSKSILDSTKLVTKADLRNGNNLGSQIAILAQSGERYSQIEFFPTTSRLKFSINTGGEGNDIGYILDSTGLSANYDYRDLNTTNDRWVPDKEYVDDAIGGVSITETDPIYAADSAGVVRWPDTTTIIATKADLVETVETVSRTIYVSTTGDDETGNGATLGTAFATILRALQDIKSVVSGATITISLNGTGNFPMGSSGAYDEAIELAKKTFINSSLVFTGVDYTTVESGFTLAKTASRLFAYTLTKSGLTATENQYRGYFATNGTNYYPVASNAAGSDAFEIEFVHTSFATATSIVSWGATITNPSGLTYLLDLGFGINYNSAISFSKLNMTTGTSTIMMLDRNQTPKSYNNVVFNSYCLTLGNATNSVNQYHYFNRCVFNSVSSISTGFLRCYALTNKITFQYNFFNTPHATGSVIALFNCSQFNLIQGNYFIGTVSIPVFSGKNFAIYTWTGVKLKNALCLYYPDRTNCILSNEPNQTNTYTYWEFENVTSLLGRNPSLSSKLQIEGVYGSLPTNLIAGVTSGYYFVDPKNDIHISVPGIYGEFETPATATLADNSTGAITVGNITQNESVKIEYKINRGTSEEVGTIVMTKKADTNLSDISYFDDCGVSFTKTLVGNAITLNWATTSTGTAATIKYSITRIML